MHTSLWFRKMTLSLLCAVLPAILWQARAEAQLATYPILHNFNRTDGVFPSSRLLQGSDGSLYGVTQTSTEVLTGSSRVDWGTVFRITPSGMFTTLYTFTGSGDHYGPTSGLVEASDGNFYGVAGGSVANNDYGAVYRITPEGAFTSIYNFRGSPNDGANPVYELTLGSDGLLYGTTLGGGADQQGTVFGLAMDGSGYKVHHSFTGADGFSPSSLKATGANGIVTLFGTTFDFGTGSSGTSTAGTLFGLGISKFVGVPDTFNTLHVFDGTNGAGPSNGFVRLGTTIYGACENGGVNDNGTIYKFQSDGTFTTLHYFTGRADGTRPHGVLLGRDGNLYTATAFGASATNWGSIVRMAPDGSNFTVLYTPLAVTDAGIPQELIQASDGNLYGCSLFGGQFGYGTIFVIDLTPPTVTATCNPPQAKAKKGTKTVTIAGALADTLSGPDLSSGVFTVQDTAGGLMTGTVAFAATGTYALKLSFSTDTPKGTTRTYTITVQAKDKQGNPGSAVTTFTVSG